MALSAIERPARWMPKTDDLPLRSGMTSRAIFPEKPGMTILCGMASSAIERSLQRGGAGRRHGSGAYPILDALGSNASFASGRLAGECGKADARKCGVIHRHRSDAASAVLRMTFDATANVGMESRRLPLQQVLIIRVADDAVHRLDTFARSVAFRATVLQKSVSQGEVAGADEAL